MKKRMKVWLVLTTVLSLVALGSSCAKKDEGGDAGTNKGGDAIGKTYAPSGSEGTVTGVIAFNGAVPAPKKIDTSADPVCGSKNPTLSTEDTVVKDGKLANAFVYIKDGSLADGSKVGDYAFAVPETQWC